MAASILKHYARRQSLNGTLRHTPRIVLAFFQMVTAVPARLARPLLHNCHRP